MYSVAFVDEKRSYVHVKMMMGMMMAIYDDGDDDDDDEDGDDKDDGDDLMMERFEAARSAAEESSIHINGQGFRGLLGMSVAQAHAGSTP